jgi:hypothetical protein
VVKGVPSAQVFNNYFAAGNGIRIKRVQGLAQLVQYVIGYIYHVIYGAYANYGQTLFKPLRRFFYFQARSWLSPNTLAPKRCFLPLRQ